VDEAVSKYDITPREMARGRNLRAAMWLAPAILTVLPIIITVVLFVLLAASPPAGITILFLGFILTLIGFVKGLILSAFFGYRYSRWKDVIREKMAADGIRAEELDWFRKELKPNEKRMLKTLTVSDELLADAYRETLASRLTATRIDRSSKREIAMARRRLNKISQLRSARSEDFRKEVEGDIEKLTSINTEAKQMLVEAESRLQMIEAAHLRGGTLADSELALKKLAARSSALPLALEEAKIAESIRKELEDETLLNEK